LTFTELLLGLGACVTHSVSHTGSKVISLGSASGLGVDTNSVLSTARASETTALVVARLQRLNLALEADGRLQLTLGVVGLEYGAVVDFDTHETGGQIGVCSEPLLGGPALVSEDSLDEKHIGESVTNSLVDEVGKSLETLQRVLLSGRLGFRVLNDLQSILRESDGTVTVGLEVDTDVESQSGVVEVLHTSVGANDGELEHLLDVVGTGTVGIGGLNDTNLQLLCNTSIAGKIANERGRESGDAITIQKAEDIALVNEVIDQAVRIAVQGGASIEGNGLGGGRGTLLGLDIVGTAL
jgi:hypothetical protein